jgi:hypothetical protein
MGNRRLHKIERFHTLGMPESEWLKVTALNLFHPTASPLLQKVGFFILRHSPDGESRKDPTTGGRVRGRVTSNLVLRQTFPRARLNIYVFLFVKFAIIRIIRI